MGDVRGTLTLESIDSGLRFRAEFGSFHHILDSGEQAVGPSPLMALLEALAGCVAMDVVSILRKKRLVVTDYRVEMLAERSETHPKRFTSVSLVHHVTGRAIDPATVAETVRLSDEKYCSVRHTLDPALRVTHRIEVHPA